MTLLAYNRRGVLVVRGDKDSLRKLGDAIMDSIKLNMPVSFTLSNGKTVMAIDSSRDVDEALKTLLKGKATIEALQDAMGGK
jgi:hypothetical protein